MSTATKTPTIHDVAREANVSAATVSRALSNPELVSSKALERVSEAVHTTGYTVNQSARSLRMRAARTIVIAFPNIGNPFYSTVLDEAVREASQRGYGALVANRLGENPTRWLRDYFLSNRADGMVLFDGSLDLTQLYKLRSPRGKFPLVVACDEHIDPRLHSVIVDNRAAGQRATRHLIELGHKRIAHIYTASTTATPVSDRMLGYRDAMAAAGLPVNDEWLISGDFTMVSGERAAHTFLALKDRPTAVFCANDEMAIGFLAVCRTAGVECPRDVSLVGFDDITVARCLVPPLTTMSQPRDDIGRLATKALLDILEGDSTPRETVRIVLQSNLIVRESTAPCRDTA